MAGVRGVARKRRGRAPSRTRRSLLPVRWRGLVSITAPQTRHRAVEAPMMITKTPNALFIFMYRTKMLRGVQIVIVELGSTYT